MSIGVDTDQVLAGSRTFSARQSSTRFTASSTHRTRRADSSSQTRSGWARRWWRVASSPRRSTGSIATASSRIDIVYICSNGDIAAQNVRKLDVTGTGAARASRLTLSPNRYATCATSP